MKLAVTGASGFLGRHVLRELGRRDVEVVAVSRSVPEAMLPSNVRHLPLDIGDAGSDPHARMCRPDALIHLAWGGLPNYLSRHHFECELPRHYQFLKRMVEGGLKSVLVTGTCFEYGRQSGELCETMPAAPTNPYGFSKDALYRQLKFLQSDRDFSLTWSRLFYMFGDGQSPSSIYSLLRTAIRRGDRQFPMSGGEQLRDFLPVEKVAEYLVDLALLRMDTGIVNVCSGQPVSVRTLVEGWVATAGSDIELDLGRYPYPSYEPLAFWGSSAKREQLLDPKS